MPIERLHKPWRYTPQRLGGWDVDGMGLGFYNDAEVEWFGDLDFCVDCADVGVVEPATNLSIDEATLCYKCSVADNTRRGIQ